MNNIVVIPNAVKDNDLAVTNTVVKKINCLGIKAYIEEKYSHLVCDAAGYTEFPKDAELIIVIGGDGSVIDASEYAIAYDLPILGVNLGRVGYLAELERNSLGELERLVRGDYIIEEKMLLTVQDANGIPLCNRYAVNDIVVSHDAYLGIADVRVEDHCGNVIDYRADGVILATPQGSTAYSLSSGGPVVAHDVDGILLTAVSPHSFFNRSVMFNSSESIRVTNLGTDSMHISIDGRCRGKLDTNEYCIITKSDKKIKMLAFEKNAMFSKLFKKMRILEDTENEKRQTN